ncbi:hypothetical protein Q5752_002918 [Cryptotrichosporon argae]
MASSTPRTVRPDFHIKVAETKDEIEACYSIRTEVFSVEQGFPLDTEMDEHDPDAVHFLLTVSAAAPAPTSTALLSPSKIASLVSGSAATSSSTTAVPVGTIRWVPALGKLTRLAVLKEYRHFGFGRVLVERMETWVAENAARDDMRAVVKEAEGRRIVKVKIHSQIPVVAFYARLGYVAEGPEFDEEGEPHQKMTKELAVS